MSQNGKIQTRSGANEKQQSEKGTNKKKQINVNRLKRKIKGAREEKQIGEIGAVNRVCVCATTF